MTERERERERERAVQAVRYRGRITRHSLKSRSITVSSIYIYAIELSTLNDAIELNYHIILLISYNCEKPAMHQAASATTL